MTTRLYCRECGWHPKFRRKRAALRAAGRHHCTGTPVAETCPPWWFRLWTNLWTSPEAASAVDAEIGADNGTGGGELVDARGNRIQWAVLAAHHAETTRRARQAVIEIVRAGYQIGPPPYGYRALRVRVTDPTGHSKLRAVLVPAAPYVRPSAKPPVEVKAARRPGRRHTPTVVACRSTR